MVSFSFQEPTFLWQVARESQDPPFRHLAGRTQIRAHLSCQHCDEGLGRGVWKGPHSGFSLVSKERTAEGLWFGDHGKASENKIAGVVRSCLRWRLLLHLETPFSAFLKHRGDSSGLTNQKLMSTQRFPTYTVVNLPSSWRYSPAAGRCLL